MTVEATGTQPITAWRCGKCGMIDDTEWVAGTHADRREAGLNKRCDGAAVGPYYLLLQDEYLDVMIELSGGAER